MKPTFTHACLLHLLRLYPRAWRERYAAEVAAVLEESPTTFTALFDLLLGILDAYIHNDLFTERKFVMAQRLRSSQIMIYCSAVFFSIVMLIYTSENDFFWYPGLANQYEYHLTLVFVDYSSLLLVLTTLVGSLAFSAVLLKQILAGVHLIGFYAWGMVGATGIAILPFIFDQIVVPNGSSDALAHIIIQLPYISSLLAIFGNEISIALVFVGLQQVLIKKREQRITSSILWLLGVFAPAMLLVIQYRFAPSYLSSYNILGGTILISLIIFGSIFILAQRKRNTALSVRPRYFHFIPTVLITLFMSVILLATLFLTISLHINISDLRLMRYTILSFILLFMALPTALAYFSLARLQCTTCAGLMVVHKQTSYRCTKWLMSHFVQRYDVCLYPY